MHAAGRRPGSTRGLHAATRADERLPDCAATSSRALYSIANGQFGGTGLGKGTFTTPDGTPIIPDLKTDFIFSALAQELGLIGIAAFLLVYMVFALRGFRVALIAEDGFSKLLAVGLTFGFCLADVHHRRRRPAHHPADRDHAALRQLRRLEHPRQLRHARPAAARLEPRRGEDGVNDRIRRVGVVARRAARGARPRHDVLADVGARRARGAGRTTRSSASRSSRSNAALICAANGKVLAREPAWSASTGKTFYLRRYPTGKLAADVVGYSTQGRSRAGLERSLNDYLTASNSNLHTVFDRTLDRPTARR